MTPEGCGLIDVCLQGMPLKVNVVYESEEEEEEEGGELRRALEGIRNWEAEESGEGVEVEGVTEYVDEYRRGLASTWTARETVDTNAGISAGELTDRYKFLNLSGYCYCSYFYSFTAVATATRSLLLLNVNVPVLTI